ncbi:MAG: hypothetical protein UY05_C0016G0008 [Candidatus Peregrinibacteria bacterium GW2011_GWA2_47_7]|nr:MAG: hypothetical protein UY05_C0016G0008 [Candidatus Peregrinibacteria bacterium GW2011_GWA2_47_7]
MNKFTIFSVFFSLALMVVIADMVIRDYVASKTSQTSVITALEDFQNRNFFDADAKSDTIVDSAKTPDDTIVVPAAPDASSSVDTIVESPANDPLISDEISFPPLRGMLNERAIKDVGFTRVERVRFDQKVFQLFDIGSVRRNADALFQVYDESGSAVGVLLEVAFLDEISSQQLYDFLKNKSKVYLDLSVNEKNDYASRSFFVNHVRKPNEVFLVFKEGKYVYCFAYVKQQHSRIKALISLLKTAILDEQFGGNAT